jgi:hypothetical protein
VTHVTEWRNGAIVLTLDYGNDMFLGGITGMNWKEQLRATSQCPPIERLGGELTLRERAHASHCARCKAEMALWEEFRSEELAADEVEAVRWISSQLGNATAAETSNVVSMLSRRPAAPNRALAAAATLAFAVAIGGYVIQNREPAIDGALSSRDSYRSSQIEATVPTGDLAAAPPQLRWTAVAGATSYEVVVLEADKTVLWRGMSKGSEIALPADVVAQFVPGKTIFWEVTARRGGGTLAQSGTLRFRVAVK